MKYRYFRIKNFKGIEDQTLDLSKTPSSNVYTLVGLNESGKTTILEAVNYFPYKNEDLKPLEFEGYEVDDIHNLIPINRRDNFNGTISIEVEVDFDQEDKNEIKKVFQKKQIFLTKEMDSIIYTQVYKFKDSKYEKTDKERIWNQDFEATFRKGKKARKLTNDEALIANDVIKKRLPSILYFPNFLFEFPEKIFLEAEDGKSNFYQKVIQDVLDSLENDTNISEHLVKRIKSVEVSDQRNLNSLIGKMEKQLTKVIFGKWNQIFNKKILDAEIKLTHGIDEKIGTFLEFNIKDDVDTYRIVERSLGFRWFFVYIFFTQFRSYRKGQKNVFFLFDEPASNLHPSAQMELLKSFEHLPKVLYTTHSHYLISPKWLENTFVIKNSAIDYENEQLYSAKKTNIQIHKYKDFAVKYPNQTSYFQPILEMLDYRPSNLESVGNVILTEGKSDYYTLKYMELLGLSLSFSIIPGMSSGNLENLISLYTGWGQNFIVLLDSDEAGIKEKNRYKDIYGPLLENRIFSLADVNHNWKRIEIENLFSEKERLTIQNLCYPEETKVNKKLFNRAIQELLVAGRKIEISKETFENFNKLLSFLNLMLENQKISNLGK